MTTKHFSITYKNGNLFTSIFQAEEHLSQNLDLESTTSSYSQILDKSELTKELVYAVEHYIEAFVNSSNRVKSRKLSLDIALTIN